MAIIISRRTSGGTGGIRKLSELEIDADKDWNGKSITNFGNLSGSAIEITTTSGDLTLNPASDYIRGKAGFFAIANVGDSGEIDIVPDTVNYDTGIFIVRNNTMSGIALSSLGAGISFGTNPLINPSVADIDMYLSCSADMIIRSGLVVGSTNKRIRLEAGSDIVLNPASGNIIMRGISYGINEIYLTTIGDDRDVANGNAEIDIAPSINNWGSGIVIVDAHNNPGYEEPRNSIWIWASQTGLIDLATDTCSLRLTDIGGISMSTSTDDIILSPAVGKYIRLPGLRTLGGTTCGTVITTIEDEGRIDITPNTIDLDASLTIIGRKNPSNPIPPEAVLYCESSGIEFVHGNSVGLYSSPSRDYVRDASPGVITIHAEERLHIKTSLLWFEPYTGDYVTFKPKPGISAGFEFYSESKPLILTAASSSIALNPTYETSTGKDIKITDPACGLVLRDRVTGTYCRLKVTNGVLGVEAA
jgi:hypothetical protein